MIFNGRWFDGPTRIAKFLMTNWGVALDTSPDLSLTS
jgi:hypothetical protein